MDHYLYSTCCGLDVPYRNLQSHFIHDIQLLQWKEPFVSRDRQVERAANNGWSNARKKQKNQDPRFLCTEKSGVTLATKNSYSGWWCNIYTSYQYKSFLCIFPMFIFILHVHKYWIQPDQGTATFPAVWGCAYPYQISEDTPNKGLQDISSLAHLWQASQSCRCGRAVWPHCSWANAIKGSRWAGHSQGGSPMAQPALPAVCDP